MMTSKTDYTTQNGNHNYPYKIVEVDDEIFASTEPQVLEIVDSKSVLVGPNKYFLPQIYTNCHSSIYNFKARPDDILLIGYPRSGTTLHCEMIWQIENNLDFETSEKVILTHRFPIIDLCLSMGDLNVMGIIADSIKVTDDVRDTAKRYGTVTIDHLASCKKRRFIRSHLPISLLSPSFFEAGCKVVYCARNPKDVVVSYYHAWRFFRPKESEFVAFKLFWKAFKNNWTMYSPFFVHMKEAWERRNDKNFLFLFYEDTVKDMRQAIVKMADFLGRELTEAQLEKLVDYLSIEKFKKNKSVNCQHLCDLGIANKDVTFVRNGKSGGWRKYFEGDLELEADEWMRENMRDTDLVFPES